MRAPALINPCLSTTWRAENVQKAYSVSGGHEWSAAGVLARGVSGVESDEIEQQLVLLFDLAATVDVNQSGPRNVPILNRFLLNWAGSFVDTRAPGDSLARLPIPGEGAWDGTGHHRIEELPAALMIARGADPFRQDDDGVCAFDLAKKMGWSALVAQMRRLPFAPNAQATTVRPTDAPHVVAQVLQSGKDPNIPESDGLVPLQRAREIATANDAGFVHALLAAGANPMVRVDCGAGPCLLPQAWATSVLSAAFVRRSRNELLTAAAKDWRQAVIGLHLEPDEAVGARVAAAAIGLDCKPPGASWGRVARWRHCALDVGIAGWAALFSILDVQPQHANTTDLCRRAVAGGVSKNTQIDRFLAGIVLGQPQDVDAGQCLDALHAAWSRLGAGADKGWEKFLLRSIERLKRSDLGAWAPHLSVLLLERSDILHEAPVGSERFVKTLNQRDYEDFHPYSNLYNGSSINDLLQATREGDTRQNLAVAKLWLTALSLNPVFDPPSWMVDFLSRGAIGHPDLAVPLARARAMALGSDEARQPAVDLFHSRHQYCRAELQRNQDRLASLSMQASLTATTRLEAAGGDNAVRAAATKAKTRTFGM